MANASVNALMIILLVLAIVGVALGIIFIVLVADNWQVFLGAGAVFYLIYFCVGAAFTNRSALGKMTEGMNSVLEINLQLRRQDLEFKWHIQCYHYETRTRTVTDSEGRSHTETYQERVNTHSASRNGLIGCTDHSEDFIPNTDAKFCYIKSKCDKDFSGSNYHSSYQQWINSNIRDTHHDVTCLLEEVGVLFPMKRLCLKKIGFQG